MYSRQQKEAILAEFHASGMSAERAAHMIPGFPSGGTLRKWLRLEELGELTPPVLYVKGRADRPKHTRYDESTKKEALKLIGRGLGPALVAKRLNVSSGSVVSGWVRAARGQRRVRPVPKKSEATVGKEETHTPVPGGWEEWALEGLPEDPEERARVIERKLIELGAVLDVLKAPGPGSLSREEKSRVAMAARARGLKLSKVCEDLNIARSTCYACAAREGRDDPYAQLKARIEAIFEESDGRYGSLRVWAELRRPKDGLEPVRAKGLGDGDMQSPVIVSEKVVRKQMRELHLVPVTARPAKMTRYNSYAGEDGERPDNLPLKEDGTHDFHADVPFELVVSDVTEFSLNDFKCYLSPMIDCFDGDLISWSISAHPDDDLCSSSLIAARLKAGRGFVVHTDGGRCYISNIWKTVCLVGGITRSMSRKGTSPDNARAEGFFGTLKREFFHNRDWSGVTFEEFVQELNSYLLWYRDGRIVKELGWKTIRQYREELGIAA